MISCPRLEKIHRHGHANQKLYYNLVARYAHSLTYVDVEYGLIDEGTATLQICNAYPKLKHITMRTMCFDAAVTMNQLLGLFDGPLSVETLNVSVKDIEDEYFMERYLNERTSTAQDLIIKKLSKMTELRMDSFSCYKNIINFVARYMTGLRTLEYTLFGHEVERLRDEAAKTAFHELLDLACWLGNSNISFGMVDRAYLFKYLTLAFKKFYLHLPPRNVNSPNSPRLLVDRILKIQTNDYLDPWEPLINLSLILERTSGNCQTSKMEFSVSESSTNNLLRVVGKDTLKDCNINTLEFFYVYDPRCRITISFDNFMSVCEELLSSLPTVTKVCLSVPHGLQRMDHPFKKFSQVKHLTLEAKKPMHEQYCIWERSTKMFPGVQYLSLRYFTGVYKRSLKQYQISLPEAKLERLYLDN